MTPDAVPSGGRRLPAMHRLLADERIAPFRTLLGDGSAKEAIDDVLDRFRAAADGESAPESERVVAAIVQRLGEEEARGLVEVLNGTGVLLHTNLGRAPLADEAFAAIAGLGGYTNLEYDLRAGARGSRYDRLGSLLRETTGAQDGIVVNNCAAAMLLILDTFARGREVVVSRNGLIEIGGGFRIPDVLARSGARLVEVGTTNRVVAADFARALSPQTGLLLRTHASNFRIEGFVADVSGRAFAELASRAGIPAVEDLGSGALVDLREYGLPHERTVGEAVAEGMSLVAFSGDKLLGGPQCGIIVGTRAYVSRLRANPLLRALRVDKTTLAALAATLRLYRDPQTCERIPLYRMLGTTIDALRARAGALAARFAASHEARVVDLESTTGGGALPLATIPSLGVAFASPHGDAGGFAARLRSGRPPLVTLVEDGRVIVDLRTIPPERDDELAAVLSAAS